MDLVKDDMRVAEALLEEQLLNQNAVCHVDYAAVLLTERLHADVVPHFPAQHAPHLLGNTYCQTRRSDSPWLANSDPRSGTFLENELRNLGWFSTSGFSADNGDWMLSYKLIDEGVIFGDGQIIGR